MTHALHSTPSTPYGYYWRTVVRPQALRRAGGVFEEGRYLGGARCQRCGVYDIFPLSIWQRSTVDVAHLTIPPGQLGHDHEDNLAVLCKQDHRATDYKEWVVKFKAWVQRQREERAGRLDAGRPLLQIMLDVPERPVLSREPPAASMLAIV